MSRVVVIDDELSIRRSLRVLLTRYGYEAYEAADGLEGLRLCREVVPDLVITDIHMPGADGIEVIAALHAMAPGLPIIAISGGDQTSALDLLGSAGMLGAVESLRKPFTVTEVLQAVSLALPCARAVRHG
jgi:two-component system response regulator (stage 0 sporulation protein F)